MAVIAPNGPYKIQKTLSKSFLSKAPYSPGPRVSPSLAHRPTRRPPAYDFLTKAQGRMVNSTARTILEVSWDHGRTTFGGLIGLASIFGIFDRISDFHFVHLLGPFRCLFGPFRPSTPKALLIVAPPPN